MSKAFEEWWSGYKWNYLEEFKEHAQRAHEAGEKAKEQRVVEDVIYIAHDIQDGFAYIPVSTFEKYLKEKYGVKSEKI